MCIFLYCYSFIIAEKEIHRGIILLHLSHSLSINNSHNISGWKNILIRSDEMNVERIVLFRIAPHASNNTVVSIRFVGCCLCTMSTCYGHYCSFVSVFRFNENTQTMVPKTKYYRKNTTKKSVSPFFLRFHCMLNMLIA